MLHRTRLVDQAIEDLTSRVEKGQWGLGAAIPPEPDLASLLGIGRSTVREAVQALAHAGMFEVRQGHGTFVRSMARNEEGLTRRAAIANIREVTEVRRGLEVEAARLAARRRRPADIRKLTFALERRWEARSGPVEAFVAADVEFHSTVIAATHNTLLVDLYRTFTVRLGVALTATTTDHDLRHDSNASHADLVAAIVARDEVAAERAAASYLDPLTNALAELDHAQ